MIRKRLALVDDSAIHRLVVEQLVPLSRASDASSATFSEIRKRLNRNVTYVVAKGARRPFGFITMICRSRTLLIDMLAVDPREQSRGWGKKLMNVAEAYGKAERCRTMELYVDDNNHKAFRFYLDRGYSVKEYVPQLACYLMSKRIT